MDLPQADPDKVAQEIEDIIGIDATGAVRCSAKSGLNVDNGIEDLVANFPAPEGDTDAPLQALIIDSWSDVYLGGVSLIRVKNCSINQADIFHIKSTGRDHLVDGIA